MLFAILSAIVFVGASGSPQANQYMDSVLGFTYPNEVRMQRLDPAQLPDFSTEFYDKMKIIGKVHGKADYFQGNLSGLTGVRRYSECQGPSYAFGAKNINCTIVFDRLNIHYDGKLKYGKMPKVNIKANANVSATLVFVQVIQNPNMPSTLKSFVFQQLGQLSVKFTGLGPLNKYTTFLDDGFKQHAQAQLFNIISQRIQYALNRSFAMVPMPN